MTIPSQWALMFLSALVVVVTAQASSISSGQLQIAAFRTGAAKDLTTDQYRHHVQQLRQIVAGCQSSLDEQHCRASLVGPDDSIVLSDRRRMGQYDWLRDVLDDSGRSSKEAEKEAEAKKTLEAADQRLGSELSLTAGGNAARTVASKAQVELRSVLAASEFSSLSEPSPWSKVFRRLFAWLTRKLSAASGNGMSPALLRTLVYGSMLCCITLLAWWFARQVRQQRLTLKDRLHEQEHAVTAVDWQIRLEQAQALAAEGEWREAVHQVYWAAISRLEASGSWPVDRARTPREYLHLLPAAGEKREALLLLTRSFELIWYGQRKAQQADFERARSLLDRLASR